MSEEQDQYIFTETSVTEGYKELSIDQLLKLADIIWKDIKSNQYFNDEKKSEEMTNIYFGKYKDFSYSFPIVMRWMIQLKTYSSKAFKKFLLKYKETKITSRKEFAVLQAEYLILLYKENNHYDQNNINNYRYFITEQLIEEEEAQSQVEKEFVKEMEVINKEKREELYNYFKYIHPLL